MDVRDYPHLPILAPALVTVLVTPSYPYFLPQATMPACGFCGSTFAAADEVSVNRQISYYLHCAAVWAC